MYCLADEQPAGWRAARLYRGRRVCEPGAAIDGPALIAERNATIVVEPGWRAQVSAAGNLELRRVRPRAAPCAIGAAADPALRIPIMLEVFNNLFMNIAEQMGLRLQNTAHSVNIKERLDFSCALFDAAGSLIANAPHMPVHLGSMSESIRTVIARNPGLKAGDVFVLNDPYHGGTHLPDITVVTPVFLGIAPRRSFFVASRGHHADVGGIDAGFDAAVLDLDRRGGRAHRQLQGARGRGVARGGAARAAGRGASSGAQSGAESGRSARANRRKRKGRAGTRTHGASATGSTPWPATCVTCRTTPRSACGVRSRRCRDGEFTLPLDNGARIRVSVRVDAERRSACIDFTGTSGQLPDNFNAPRSITVAAVLYVFRTLVDDEIPLNAGCLKPLDIIVPEGCMLNPRPPAAVVAGNVETSTCVTNALYGALGVMAASQCTMNNFTFGNARHQYYETIAGGSGAGPGFAGASVVQTHMTNSRLTDPEVLEFRYPVRLDSFEIRARFRRPRAAGAAATAACGGFGSWSP